MRLLDLLLGRKLANYEGEERKISAIEGVPALGLDGLASSAYGPEAALVILGAAGAAGLGQIEPIMIAIRRMAAPTPSRARISGPIPASSPRPR